MDISSAITGRDQERSAEQPSHDQMLADIDYLADVLGADDPTPDAKVDPVKIAIRRLRNGLRAPPRGLTLIIALGVALTA